MKKLIFGLILIKLNFRQKTRNLKQCDSAKKGKRGDPLGFSISIQLHIIKNIEGGTLSRQKNLDKKLHSADRNAKGGSYSLVLIFVSYVKRGTLCTHFNAFPPAGPVV